MNLLNYFRHEQTHPPRLSEAWPLDLPLVCFSERPKTLGLFKMPFREY